MSKPVLPIIFFVLLVFSACVSIPPEHLTVSQRSGSSAVQAARDCEPNRHKYRARSRPKENSELDSGGFRILTWNMFKGMKEGWKEDFEKLTASYDILTIQEARLTDDLRQLLTKGHYNWDISIAFRYYGEETGVLTASKPAPEFTCTYRIQEPMIILPKTAMVTLYPLSKTDKTLMVVNIHSINFTLGIESFNEQLQKVVDILSHHDGPVIFSGDVNTWSDERMAILKDISLRLGLKAVPFNERDRTRVFGHAIDHIYYRELTVTDAEVIKVTSSDHNPMMVSFRLDESG